MSYLSVCLYVRVGAATGMAGGLLLGVCGLWVWFSCAGAARLLPRVTDRLYGNEGSVSLDEPTVADRRGRAAATVLLVGIASQVALSVLGVLPLEWMQPISALYVVPALLLFSSSPSVRATGTPFMLIWPALYVLHAGLLVGGVPIRFAAPLDGLNMLLPVAGYGLVAVLAGHLYSRYALRRLRRLARTAPEEAADE